MKTDSSSQVTLSAVSSSTFNTILKGVTTVTVKNGSFVFTQVTLVTEPDSQLSLRITTNSINPTLPDNIGGNSGQTNTQSISTRKCIEGEAFSATGECLTCKVKDEYLL